MENNPLMTEPKPPLRFVIALGCLLPLGACASIASDNITETAIETEPAAASCKFYGHRYFHQVATPASVTLPAKAAPITLICEAEGHRREVAYLDTEADGWIFGNMLLGGGIGIMIDGASGAGQEYPERVFLPLEPLLFADTTARDAWYATRREEIESRWQQEIDAAEGRCEDRTRETPCVRSADDLLEQRDAELAKLEARRLAAGTAKDS